MKHCNALLAVLIALFMSIASANLKAQTVAPPEPSEVVQLPQFDVSETQADRYHAGETLSVNRVAGDILSSPVTINVISAGLLSDLGADAMYDATHFFAGVSPGRGTGSGGFEDRQDFRGFENLGKTIDNFSGTILSVNMQGLTADIDPAFVERAELVMGPDTILSPTGTPGGSVNIITKSPKFEKGGDITAEVGNYNAQKFVLDDYGPIGSGKHLAYRVVVSLQDAKTFEPGNLYQSNVEAALEYDFSSKVKLVTKFLYEKWIVQGNVANGNDNGIQVFTPDTVGGATLSNTPPPGFQYNGWNASPSWSVRPDTYYFYEATLTAALDDHINMRLGASFLRDNLGPQESSFYSVVPSETFNAATGQVTGVSAVNPAAIPVLGYWADQSSAAVQLQNDFAANYHPGPVSLQPVVGWDSQAASNPLMISLQDHNMATVNLATNNTVPFAPPLSQFTSFAYNEPNYFRLIQGYGVVRVGFLNDRIFVTGGASRTWLKADVYSYGGGYVPGAGYVGAAPGASNYLHHYTLDATGNALLPSQPPYHDSYLMGVVGKVTKNVSVYGSYTTNSAITASVNPLWSLGKQYEFGVKSEFFDQRLMLSVAHFQIAETNITSVNPLFNTGQSTIQNFMSDMTNHGFEFNASGSITRNLSLIASATDMRLRDDFGRRQRNVPDAMANLLLNYSFRDGPLANLSAFVGVQHMGDVAGETESGVTSLGVPEQPGFYVAAWTVYNAGASYRWNRYSFTLNVDNALNSQFWWQPSSRISVSPYPGITCRLTTSVHF